MSVQKSGNDNQKATIMFADSRDPDIRKTSKTAYFKVDFKRQIARSIEKKIKKEDEKEDEC